MSDKFTSLFAACATTLMIFAAGSPANAEDQPITVVAQEADIPVRYVSYRDLNLAATTDEQRLVHRVRYAVNKVCETSVPTGTRINFAFTSCRTQSWNGARPQIDRAVTRAREIAANGFSAIAPVSIRISLR